MKNVKRIAFWGIIGIVATAVAMLLLEWRQPDGVRLITGAVLTADTDLTRQRPIAEARVSAVAGASSAIGITDESGLFRLTLDPPFPPDQPVTLKVEHPDYHTFEADDLTAGRLHLVRLEPVAPAGAGEGEDGPEVVIANARVRYTFKTETTVEIASAARTFEVVNKANVPCGEEPLCSPDGRWKAALGTFSLDAGESRQFRNIRLSCLAGPCPFTRVQSDEYSRGGQVIAGSVLNWSDTVTYLVEAEVAQHIVSDLVRHSYPAIFERFMNFTLPPGAQGPSIEA
ncbi:MAG: carboxypeptidase-like regulatory domain-containing protein, partial [Vicinamibacterales bacterium]